MFCGIYLLAYFATPTLSVITFFQTFALSHVFLITFFIIKSRNTKLKNIFWQWSSQEFSFPLTLLGLANQIIALSQ